MTFTIIPTIFLWKSFRNHLNQQNMHLRNQPFRPNMSKTNQKSHNRSLVDLRGTNTLQLSQHHINFINTEINQLYQISINIRNVSAVSQKIKVKKPINSCFTVQTNREGSLASGLDMKLVVLFDSKQNQRRTDKIVVMNESVDIEIPINVYPHVGKLEFEPFINFGFVRTGSMAEAEWVISNKGEAGMKLYFEPLVIDQNVTVSLSSEEVFVQAGEYKTVRVSLTSKVAGPVEGCIEIEPKTIGYSTLQFAANFCDYSRMISDSEGNQMKEKILEPLFAGQSKSVSAFLVNNSPQGCSFRLTRKKGSEDDNVSLVTPQQIGKDDSQKLVQFAPSQGEVEAYSSVEIKATVMNKFGEEDQQTFCNYILGRSQGNFEKEWTYKLRTHLSQDDQNLDLLLQGTSLIPKLSLTPHYLEFGTTTLQSRKKKSFRVENFSSKAVLLEFQNSPNYSFHPQKVKISSQGATKVQVQFCPKKVGEVNQICCLSSGVFSFPIKVFGKSVFRCKGEGGMSQEVPLDELNRSDLEEEVSTILKGKTQMQSLSGDINKNSVHFDSYRQSSNQSQQEEKTLFCEVQKRTRLLRNKNGKQQKIDLALLNPNQPLDIYPSATKSQQEERLVAKELTSSELRSVSVGPVLIDIGQILLRSVQKKYFHICNFNQKPISIKLEAPHASFAETAEQRQILPAESHGGFALMFEALSEGPFKHSLQYVLNGCHFFEMMVTGTCVLPSLTLSRNEIRFNIGEEDKHFQKRESLSLENPFDYDVNYDWAVPQNSSFSIEQPSGTVKARSSLSNLLVYTFGNGGDPGVKIEETMKLKIKFGKSVEVKCSALIPQSPCTCKSQQVNFREVAIGRTAECKILIKNVSKVGTIYKVMIPKELEQLLVVGSRTGSILAEDMLELSFKVTSSKVMQVDSVVHLAIKGSKNIELPVKANIILPHIFVQNQEVDFGNVPVEGNPGEKQINIVNCSSITVDLELRLLNDTFLAKCLRLGNISDNNVQVVEVKELKTYKAIFLKVSPQCRATLNLEFYPETADDYQFYLPFFLPGAEPMEELQKLCKCKGIKNKLIIQNKEVCFGKIVIEQTEQTYSKSQQLQIFNPQDQPIIWWADDSCIAPFKLERSSGKLEGFQKCHLKVFFSAQTPGECQRQLKFFIDQTDIDISKCYTKVDLKAESCYPTLFFDRPYLVLPTVRCGELSAGTFQICNGGYENVNLKHSLSQQFSDVSLNVRYLNGSNLGVTRKQIKVQVSFVSDKPISFTAKLNFYDNNGRTFCINVSGTSDTHTFTLLNFQGNAPALSTNLQKSCQFLKYYLNSVGCLPDQLYQFPGSLIENDYEKLSILLSRYSLSFQKVRSQVKRNCRTFFSFEYTSEIIKVLKAEGAFLNHIRPQMLLSYEEYLQNIRIRAEDNSTVLAHFRKQERDTFSIQQKQSWLILFYQIFKVFSLVNAGKPKAGCEFWAKFQARQKMILSWLQKSYFSEASIELSSRGNQLLTTMNNCQLLASLISKYTNIKVFEYYGKGIKGQKEKQRRCKSVIDTFSQIGINCLFRLEDLMRSSEKQMLLVLQNLYTILPSYLQKGDPIVFSCQFGQIVTKSVEITNPSKHQLTYIAKVEGCKAFSVEGQSEFVIDSKKSHEVKIRYFSNMNMGNSSSTLTLTGKASSKYTPSTFVFVLKSNTLGRISQKSVQVTGNLYEQLDFNVKVTNHFSQDAQFKIQMVSSKAPYTAFYLPVNTLKVKKGESIGLGMIFIPFTLDSQQVLLIFKDEKVGEFQYEVNGTVEGSVLCQEVLRIPQTLMTCKRYTLQLPIPSKNDLIQRARKAAQFVADRLQKKQLAKEGKHGQAVVNYFKYYPKLNNLETFTARLSTPNNSIVLKSTQITIKDGEQEQANKEQKLIFEVNLKSPIKEGSFSINLRNAAGTDIRKYKVSLNAVARPLRYQLQMKTPTNRPLMQPLPLINLSSEKNTFHLSLQPSSDNSRAVFSIDCQRELVVEPREQQLVNLSFKPKQLSTYNALLKVENITSGQHVEYEIIGISQEPDTETVAFEQEVRREKTHTVKLPLSKLTRCTVQQFDLQNVQFSRNFQCTPDQPFFRFKILPKRSGKMEGKLLIQADQQVFAFKVSLNVTNTIEGQIKLRTVERKLGTAEIQVVPGEYQIICEDPNVKHPGTAIVTQEKACVQIGYYSSRPEEKEIYLTMVSNCSGEHTYLLKVIVDPMPEIKVEPFKVQLGNVHREKVVFQNTDELEMIITCKSTHPQIFYSQQETFTVPARSSLENILIYKASSLELQEGKLFFTSDNNAAKWTYHLSGYGLPQVNAQRKEMTVFVGEHVCEPITFRNPLNKTIPFHVSLENIEGEGAFSVLLKSHKIQLGFNQQLQIPVSIKPTSVSLNVALLKIFVNEKISWKYELRAKTVFKCQDEVRVFKIQSREKVQQTIQLPLPFSSEYHGQSATLNITGAGDSSASFLRNAIKTTNSNYAVILAEKVSYTLSILSFKPKNVLTFFQVSAGNGCKWIYKVRFNFLAPPVDDCLTIATPINKPASYQFRLTNRVKSFAKFHAYFSSNSCIDFTVSPKSGQLEPYGREGTPIEVIFCPTQYKKSWTGRLIIETEEGFWSYDVKGSLPHYSPPVGKSSLRQ